jgi:hypothetical protein
MYIDADNNLSKFKIFVGAGTDKNLVEIIILSKVGEPILKGNGEQVIFDSLSINKGSQIIPMNGEEIELHNLIVVSFSGS